MDTLLAFTYNIQCKYFFVHRILQSFGFFLFDCFLLIVVDNFVSVDVILLPELLFVVVEELVGAVLELHTLHPQAGVRQPAQVGADQPGLAGHLLRQTRAANGFHNHKTLIPGAGCPHTHCPHAPGWGWRPGRVCPRCSWRPPPSWRPGCCPSPRSRGSAALSCSGTPCAHSYLLIAV